MTSVDAQTNRTVDSIKTEIKKLEQITDNKLKFIKKKQLINLLHKNNYPLAQLDTTTKQIKLGEKITQIYAKRCNQLRPYMPPEILFQCKTLQQFQNKLDSAKLKLRENGFAFETIYTKQVKNINNELYIYICVDQIKRRLIDDVKLSNYKNIPKTYLLNSINKRLTNRKPLQLNKKIGLLEEYLPVKLDKNPSFLYKKDSTKLYLNFRENKTNEFSGVLGFSNENKKFKLNGDLNLKLQNLIKLNETLQINYRNTNSNQEEVNLNLNLPFLFKFPIISETKFKLFNQDSTFNNTYFRQSIHYIINDQINTGVLYESQKSNNSINSDENFNYNGIGVSTVVNSQKYGNLRLNLNYGEKTNENSTERVELHLNYFKEFKISQNFYIKTTLSYAELISSNYSEGEVYRVGGINNLRGFLENSIVATQYTNLIVDHEFRLTNELTTFLTSDLGVINNKYNNLETTPYYSLGFGLDLKRKNNNIRLIIANGFSNNTNFNTENTKVHILLTSFF